MTQERGLTRELLEQRGFCGFLPFNALTGSGIPNEAGIYVVVRSALSAPVFLPESPAGHFKGKDPTVTVDLLEAAWVDGAEILYIGNASTGSNGRRGLRTRLNEYRRHGSGQPVGHWGGRYIWQLEGSASLLVAWRPTPDEDPAAAEARLIKEFTEIYGKRPFANRSKGVAAT